jgi:hypothetical protein
LSHYSQHILFVMSCFWFMISEIPASANVHGCLWTAVVAVACLVGRGDEPEIPGKWSCMVVYWVDLFCDEFNVCFRMLYRALEMHGPMRYWRRSVTVCPLFRDCKEAWFNVGVYMFQRTCAVIRPLCLLSLVTKCCAGCIHKNILRLVIYYAGVFLIHTIVIYTYSLYTILF